MNKIFLCFFLLFIVSCSPSVTPEETVNLILEYAEEEAYGPLESLAPFLSELSEGDKESVRLGLEPYFKEKPFIEVRRKSFKNCTLVLYTHERESRALIMTLYRDRGTWFLSEDISYTQKIGFIPVE